MLEKHGSVNDEECNPGWTSGVGVTAFDSSIPLAQYQAPVNFDAAEVDLPRDNLDALQLAD